MLVYDRTEAVAPTAAFFFAAKFLPALLAPALTARFDQIALRKSLPMPVCPRRRSCSERWRWSLRGDFVLVLVLALGLLDGALAITARVR